jgi:hypothetical protein
MQLFAYRLLQLMRSTSVTEFQQLEQQKTATRTNEPLSAGGIMKILHGLVRS